MAAETVAQTGRAMREAAGIVAASRHSSSGDRRELRLWVARLSSGARWCERRTDGGELWEAELWRPVLEVELSRRRCSECGRVRGRAAIAGGLCWSCRPASCDRCGGAFPRPALSRLSGVLVCDGCRCSFCGDRFPDGSRTCPGCIPF